MKLLGVCIASSAAFINSLIPDYLKVTKRTDCQDFAYNTRGKNYVGTIFFTVSGRYCQRWSSQSPHTHSQSVPSGSDDNWQGFCRNPGKESTNNPKK